VRRSTCLNLACRGGRLFCVLEDCRADNDENYRRTDAGKEYDMSILTFPEGWENSLNDVYWAKKVCRELISYEGLGPW